MVAPAHLGMTERGFEDVRPKMLSPLASLLRCLECRSPLGEGDDVLRCIQCGWVYPVEAGTPRMVRVAEGEESGVKQRTADSFAYEWRHFGELRDKWRKNFLDYVRPHSAESFSGCLVLDVGAGSGRHSRQAAELGADVVAVDFSDAIEVARANLPERVLTVQADAEDLPFAPGTFDFVMSIGVLHHLPNPERAFRSLVRYARPGGFVHIYLYWLPARSMHRRMLRLVTAARRVTVRLPHRVLHAATYPIAAALFLLFVLPYRVLRSFSSTQGVAATFPLKAYADYPFRVCVNDQFDRFSAPIEHRYAKEEVAAWFRAAGLEEVTVLANNGWVASGRMPP
jgi:2-polyprenyl-3-methyl-5-hydroxy-6-metoxy-1,4-benzoquinol methylase/uncharacterized protein YbaR (Trm112 family)